MVKSSFQTEERMHLLKYPPSMFDFQFPQSNVFYLAFGDIFSVEGVAQLTGKEGSRNKLFIIFLSKHLLLKHMMLTWIIVWFVPYFLYFVAMVIATVLIMEIMPIIIPCISMRILKLWRWYQSRFTKIRRDWLRIVSR